jgi:hypothetical protein
MPSIAGQGKARERLQERRGTKVGKRSLNCGMRTAARPSASHFLQSGMIALPESISGRSLHPSPELFGRLRFRSGRIDSIRTARTSLRPAGCSGGVRT